MRVCGGGEGRVPRPVVPCLVTPSCVAGAGAAGQTTGRRGGCILSTNRALGSLNSLLGSFMEIQSEIKVCAFHSKSAMGATSRVGNLPF